MRRRLISWMAALALLCTTVQAALWPAWGQSALQWAQERQLSEEFLSNPDAVVTRGQSAQLLYEAAGRPESGAESPFTDTAGSYETAIAWAAEQGYVQGVGNEQYLPAQTVKRQDFAALLYRQAGSAAVQGEELSLFADEADISSYAEDALLWGVKTGLFSGDDAGRLLPQDQITVAEAATLLRRLSLLPDTAALQADLDELTAVHRPIGSEGEQTAAEYLVQRFEEMGYEVSLQPYTDDAGRTGSNVIAVKNTEAQDADILVLSAHHDSVPTAYGANDNASGVAALLAVAEAVKDLPTDTELRFISFTDEENGKNGSRFYTASLSEEERSRMIGDIQLDMLGGLGSCGTLLATTDGEDNYLTDLLCRQNGTFTVSAETASDHTSFQLAGIPSVLVMQNGQGYLYHSAADTANHLDLHAIADAAAAVTAAVEEILSPDTASYQTVASEQGAGYTYQQRRQTVIYFGSSLQDSEAYIGAAGELVDTSTVSGGWWTDTYETYRYSMRWFDAEEPMNTYYQYRNGFLESIEIRPGESGYTTEEVRALIEAMYGEPTTESTDSTSWADVVYSKYITLSTGEDGSCTVGVGNYSVGLTNILSSYQVVNGEAEIADPEDALVWDYLCSILPAESRQKITEFNLFTDGTSNVLAYTAPIQREDGTNDNTQFAISIDYYDVYDENGEKRDWSKLTYTILHEYGHVLLEDETQVDLSAGGSSHDPVNFIVGSFRKDFYDRFWADLGDTGVNDYEENPTHYVSRYGANYFHEDIADTFAVFVLADKPTGSTVAEEKLLFFWDDGDMVALRSAIRANIGLSVD